MDMRYLLLITLLLSSLFRCEAALTTLKNFTNPDFVINTTGAPSNTVHTSNTKSSFNVTNLYILDPEFFNPSQFYYDPTTDNMVSIKDLASVTNLLATGLYNFAQVMFIGNTSPIVSIGSNILATA